MMVKLKQFAKHINHVFTSWEGLPIVHRRFTEQTDLVGRTTGRTHVDRIIRGTIGSLPEDSKLLDMGWLNRQNMVGFLLDTTVREHDQLIYDNQIYEVVKIHGRLLDIENEIAITAELARIGVVNEG